MIERLSAALVEEGKDHPFVRAVVEEAGGKRRAAWLTMEAQAMAADVRAWHAGRASAFRDVVDMIQTAKGKEDDEH